MENFEVRAIGTYGGRAKGELEGRVYGDYMKGTKDYPVLEDVMTMYAEGLQIIEAAKSGGQGQAEQMDIIWKLSEGGEGSTTGYKVKILLTAHARNKKAMLSQPMAGRTDEEIVSTREKAIEALKDMGYEIVNTLFTDEWYSREAMEAHGVVQIPLRFLAKSLENMSLCHAAYFCRGWENARGCRIEHEAAKAYGLEIIYEEG